MQITIENLKEVKKEIFNSKITEEEKDNIINDIIVEIEKILSDFDKKEVIEIDE